MRETWRCVRAGALVLLIVITLNCVYTPGEIRTVDRSGDSFSKRPKTFPEDETEPRKIYIDLGANWAQTLDLHTRLCKAVTCPDENIPFKVFSFEASPYIAPFVEATVSARNAGRAGPSLPFPSAGSTRDLIRINRESRECPESSPDELRKCYYERHKHSLDQLKPLQRLNSSSLIEERLRYADVESQNTDRYVFIPAAVGVENTWLKVKQSKLSLLIGGTTSKGTAANFDHLNDELFPETHVRIVDFVQWLTSYMRISDFVLVKMDVEGAEHWIIPHLIETGADSLIDVLAWECHGKGGECPKLAQRLDKTSIHVLDEKKDYDGWGSE